MSRQVTVLILFSAVVMLACQLQYALPAPSASPTARATRTPTLARVEPSPPPTAAPQPPAPAPSGAVVVIATTTENLRVRAEPSATSKQVGLLNKGDTAQVIGRNAAGDWYEILIPSSLAARGWIFARFATVDAPIDSIPIVTPGSVNPPGPVPPQSYPAPLPPSSYP